MNDQENLSARGAQPEPSDSEPLAPQPVPDVSQQPALGGPAGCSRRRVLWGLAAGALGLATVGIGGRVLLSRRASVRVNHPVVSLPQAVLRYRHAADGYASVPFWSPDSKQIATLLEGGDGLQTWDALDGGHLLRWRPPQNSNGSYNAFDLGFAWSFGWSAQGLRAAWVDVEQGVEGERLHVHDVTHNQELAVYHAESLVPLSFSPDGRWLAFLSNGPDGGNEVLSVWDITTGSPRARFTAPSEGPEETFRGFVSGLDAIAWSDDGQRLLAWTFSGALSVFDLTTGTVLSRYRQYVGQIDPFSISGFGKVTRFSPDGRSALTSLQGPLSGQPGGQVLSVWDVTNGHQSGRYQVKGSISAVAWSPDGMLLAAVEDQGKPTVFLHLWDVSSGEHLLQWPLSQITPLAWKPGSRRLASSGEGSYPLSSFQVWDAPSRTRLVTYGGPGTLPGASGEDPNALALSLAWSPDGQFIAATDLTTGLAIWQERDET